MAAVREAARRTLRVVLWLHLPEQADIWWCTDPDKQGQSLPLFPQKWRIPAARGGTLSRAERLRKRLGVAVAQKLRLSRSIGSRRPPLHLTDPSSSWKVRRSIYISKTTMNESKASTTQTAQSGSQLQEFRRRYACNCLYLSLSVPAIENPWSPRGFLIFTEARGVILMHASRSADQEQHGTVSCLGGVL